MNLNVQVLSGVLDDNVFPTFILSLVNGSARRGQDFLHRSSSSSDIFVNFDSSTMQQSIAIAVIDDDQAEGTENFIARLSLYFSGENDNIVIAPSEAVITIIDDDDGK